MSSSQITPEWIADKADRVERLCADIIAVVDELDTLEEKKEGFVAIFSHLVDVTDTPGIPDWIGDPLMKAALGPAFDAMAKRFDV